MMALLNAGHAQSWDEAGMMKQSVVPAGSPVGVAGTNEYGYDVDRKRAWKKITRSGSIAEHAVYIHAGPNLVAEYSAGTAAASPAQEYVYAQEIDSLVMLVRSTGGGSGNEKLAITRNQQWSVTALTDATSGTVLERYTYDHFGKRTILEPNGTTVRATSSYNMPFGYTSRQHDAETGLMYFRARYFDPASGEFTSPDPLEYVDGMSLFRGYFALGFTDPMGRVTRRRSQDDDLLPVDPLTLGAGNVSDKQAKVSVGKCKWTCGWNNPDLACGKPLGGTNFQDNMNDLMNAIVQQGNLFAVDTLVELSGGRFGPQVVSRRNYSALRHCFASAKFARFLGCSCAGCLGHVREQYQYDHEGQSPIATKRVDFNNSIGRCCAGCG